MGNCGGWMYFFAGAHAPPQLDFNLFSQLFCDLWQFDITKHCADSYTYFGMGWVGLDCPAHGGKLGKGMEGPEGSELIVARFVLSSPILFSPLPSPLTLSPHPPLLSYHLHSSTLTQVEKTYHTQTRARQALIHFEKNTNPGEENIGPGGKENNPGEKRH